MPETSPWLQFEVDDTTDPTLVTRRVGVPLMIELLGQRGVTATIDPQVVVKRQHDLKLSQFGENLVALWMRGGDTCQGLTVLREDRTPATLFGCPVPAATMKCKGLARTGSPARKRQGRVREARQRRVRHHPL